MTQGKYSREKPIWLKKNIKHKDSEPKIRTWHDTAWNRCNKDTRIKHLKNWRVHKPSECRDDSTKNPARGDKRSSIQKRLKLANAMETLIQYSDDSGSDGDKG